MKRITSFLTNISVNWKLNLIIAVMILGLLAVFISAIVGLQGLQASLSVSYDQIVNSNTATAQLSESLLILQTRFEALLVPNLSTSEHNDSKEAMKSAIDKTAEIIQNYEAVHLSTNNPDLSAVIQANDLFNLQSQEIDTFTSLKRSFVQYLIADQQFQELQANGISDEYFAATTKTRLANVQQNLSQLVEINNKYTEAFREISTTTYQNTVGYMAIALILTIVIGWVFTNYITRSIGNRLEDLEHAASSIENQVADLRFNFRVEGNDEIAKLGATFDRLFKKLKDSLSELEDRVEERTASLAEATAESEKRAKQFEAVTLVGGAIASIRSLEELLPKVTELISRQFEYYHAGIFLNDTNNEYAVLSAANSEGGKRMLARGHQLKVGAQGIVGYATGTGKPRIALDVGEDATYFDNPDMPETRSEMALPLKIGESVIGALDVQSKAASAFSEEDIGVLSLLADQVSMAIENARLFDQARRSLAESEALYRQYIRQAWGRLPKEQDLAGYRYSAMGAVPIKAKTEDIVKVEAQNSEVSDDKTNISVPISIRGEMIGTLSVQVPQENKLNNNQLDLVNAVAERVALSAENARLFEETNRRAERERLVSDITMKIRSTNDPDTMIQTTLNELKTALGATEVELIPHTLQKTEAPKKNNQNAKQQLREKKNK